MKYARIIDDVVVETCTADPETLFHPVVAAEFVAVADEVETGAVVNADGDWSFPSVGPSVESTTEEGVKVGPTEFKLLWTSEERLRLKALRTSDDVIDDFWEIIDDSRLQWVNLGLQSTKRAIDYCIDQLVQSSIINSDEVDMRRNQIFSAQMM